MSIDSVDVSADSPASEPAPKPHLAQRRAIRHLVCCELSDAELHALATGAASGADFGIGQSSAPPRVITSLMVAAPRTLAAPTLEVVTPLAGQVGYWDGRTPASSPDVLIAAAPWRSDLMLDVPGLPTPLRGAFPVLLPITFTSRSVTVGPFAGAENGPCLACVQPAISSEAGLPDAETAPTLFAFAAGAAGLLVRAYTSRSREGSTISLTFDMASPRVIHRVWGCTAACRSAA